jgi:hypothetical protein
MQSRTEYSFRANKSVFRGAARISKAQTTADSISPVKFSKIVFSGTAFREYHRLDLPLIRTDGNPLGRGITSMCGDESHMDLRNSSPRS